MAKKESSVAPTRPDLLARIDALPEKAVDICKMAGLTIQFISAMRLGKCQRTPEGSWLRLIATIELLEAKHGKSTTLPPAGPSPVDKAMDEVADAIAEADTLEKWILIQRKVTELSARGIFDPARTRVLNEAMNGGRALFKAQAEDAERAKAGQEMVVTVKYIDTWRKPLPKVQTCGHGEPKCGAPIPCPYHGTEFAE